MTARTTGPLMGRYAEEFATGDRLVTPSRTMTEADIAAFAALTGDYNPIHTDEEFARDTAFGGRIAHGLLTLSVMVGLVSRLGVLDGTIMAFTGIDRLKFREPVRAGDTIHGELTVQRTRLLPSRACGLVNVDALVINHRGSTVLTAELGLLFRARPRE
jgi:acyl dehydratase